MSRGVHLFSSLSRDKVSALSCGGARQHFWARSRVCSHRMERQVHGQLPLSSQRGTTGTCCPATRCSPAEPSPLPVQLQLPVPLQCGKAARPPVLGNTSNAGHGWLRNTEDTRHWTVQVSGGPGEALHPGPWLCCRADSPEEPSRAPVLPVPWPWSLLLQPHQCPCW